MMQTASFYQPPLAAKQTSSLMGDSTRASVNHLLAGAYSTPCSTAAHAFVQIVPPLSRFQLALDVLMPMLDASVELTQRILVSYILYSLYAPHPISLNPFNSVLYATFVRERDAAVQVASAGGVSENEQLVWVLWKILKGDGSDIGPFSPNTLARSPLPPKLRAANLNLEDETVVRHPTESTARDGAKDAAGSLERDEETEKYSRAATLLLAARERVLSLSEQRVVLSMMSRLTSPPLITSVDLPSILATNPALGHPLVAALLCSANDTGPEPFLDVIKRLPPILPSFDLIGRLLRDSTGVADVTTGGRTTIADLVRTEVLGWFVHECVAWLDRAEQDEREGNISDDRFAKGVQNLCRFYNSLIKLGIVDPASDADSAEMAHFTLRNSRFEEANALYRVLAMGKF
ncbi:hypothetical protein BD309DRAFT_961631 [Dichomitus squalens]|uniref:Uncharacterized protein n=1 Tax=Dichomitus squalens TaxID=114155 RepID=A0A4Q9NSY8_9APHY|nr:hypothetical protein BD311DRAFT_262081 [Dichomitus squalens]TBU43041.1 hypothetical protein BD309DRAFT_961631 [Dichomitus squalens]